MPNAVKGINEATELRCQSGEARQEIVSLAVTSPLVAARATAAEEQSAAFESRHGAAYVYHV